MLKVLHDFKNEVVNRKLFKSAKSYLDIENSLFAMGEDYLRRGWAFEVFAEAYLKLGLYRPLDNVYPENVIPPKLKDNLKLPQRVTNQIGIDGVYETQSDQYFTYQVKFKNLDQKLNYNDLGGSIGISSKASGLMVFTNLETIPKDIENHGGFGLARADLLGIDDYDIKRIVDFIYKDKVTRAKPFDLHDFQKEAFHDVIKELKVSDRTQLIMACGTGKTLVGQRIIEKMDGKISLILVPSLSLLEQTIEDYFNQSKWNEFPAIFVGSDSSIPRGYDGIELQPSELKYEITTEPKAVKEFISKKFKRHVIFSTYQSANVVGSALKGKTIDFALFDEAHKTASKEQTNFAFALSDKNIRIKKRLFMTATPRKYEIRRIKRGDDVKEVFSMDDEKIYGKRAHVLTFHKAAELGMICKYKLIISVITSVELDRSLLRHGETIVGGEVTNAEYAAKNFALHDAIKKSKAKKIISFHRTINQSEYFVGASHLSIGEFVKDYNLYHVNGKMNTKTRKSILNEFKNDKNSLVSNASCLTEGVNIPAVDMVAFMSPKKSKVDIVQAVGRALRKPKGSKKEMGYIVIPIFVEQAVNETIEEASDRTDYSTISDVLRAMIDNDEVIEQLIKTLRIKKGIKGKFDKKPLDEYVEVIGEGIDLEFLKDSITSYCIDRQSSVKLENWGTIYKQVKQLKEDIESGKLTFDDIHLNKFTYPNVLLSNLKGDMIEANTWVNSQRDRFKKDGFKGQEFKIPLLKKIPYWTFDYEKSVFYYWYELLVEYEKEFGDVLPVATYVTKDGDKLGGAIVHFRQKKDELKEEYKAKLETFDTWVWTFDIEWMDFKEARKFARKLKIVGKQWLKYCKGELKDKPTRPDNIPTNPSTIYKEYIDIYDWLDYKRNYTTWDENYEKSKKYYEKNGDCAFPVDHVLYSWAKKNRNKKKLTANKIKRLDAIEWIWSKIEYDWIQNYKKLLIYKKEYGDCDVPQDYIDDPQLGTWVSKQRERKKDKRITEKQEQLLIDIGFSFDNPRTAPSWEEVILDIIDFYKGKPTTTVIKPKHKPLYTRSVGLKQEIRHGRLELSEEYRNIFLRIGYKWNDWEYNYYKLIEYYEENGHFEVKRSEIQVLYTFVHNLRKLYKDGKLENAIKSHFINELNELGFPWEKPTYA